MVVYTNRFNAKRRYILRTGCVSMFRIVSTVTAIMYLNTILRSVCIMQKKIVFCKVVSGG